MGLLLAPRRIWSAARRSAVTQGPRKAAGHWDTAVAGPSALRAALHGLLRAEAAEAMGIGAAGVFYDAVNVYDNRSFGKLVERAVGLGYPAVPLAMAARQGA